MVCLIEESMNERSSIWRSLKHSLNAGTALLLGHVLAGGVSEVEAADCAGLLAEKFVGTEITTSEKVTSGTLAVTNNLGAPTTLHGLPAFCRVAGVLRPTADSRIGFEVWLPERWNGRYLQVGNGGFAGVIWYGSLVQWMDKGFAVANTDTGHTGVGAEWALGHPEKLIDYGHRAVHLTSIAAKAIVGAYYNRPSFRSYFSGCSNGGRESLMEAQRYPDDFDGWVVGAPANNFTSLMTRALQVSKVVSAMREPLTVSQLEALSQAALARCDGADGVKDGVIEEPLRCHFDPIELSCKGASDGKCLSNAQVDMVRGLYDDSRDAAAQASLAPGLQGTLGAESGLAQWQSWITGPLASNGVTSAPFYQFFSENFWPYMVYDQPILDFRTLDPLQASKDGRSRAGSVLNSVDPDLSAVRAAGKKIIHYHGWADAAISAQYSIGYYEAVEKYLGRDNRDFYRLFLAPGMGHCERGPGPNIFGAGASGGSFDPDHDVVAALMRWVEEGQAPERIVATKYQDDDVTKPVLRTRPLCVYPRVATWTGKGSADDAASFVCRN
jgi:feruloyl esterase